MLSNSPLSIILPALAMLLFLANVATAADADAPAPADSVLPDGHQNYCSAHAHSGNLAGMEQYERMGTELALSDTQKQELGALLEMYRPRMKELADRGVASSLAMLDVAPDDPTYNTRAAELSQLAGATAAEMITLLTELQANAYALLTSSQQAQFLELRAEQRQRLEAMHARMQEYRERGDWKHGKHFGHTKREHCMHMPSLPENAKAPSGAAN